MRTIISAILWGVLLTAIAEGDEKAKPKVATIQLNAVMRDRSFSGRASLLALDKDTLAAIKKINKEIKVLQDEIVEAKNQEALNELQNKLQFLTQKVRILTQRSARSNARRDLQSVFREFVIANYTDKFQLIFQQDAAAPDVILWKGGVEMVDITEDAKDRFREWTEDISGGSLGALPDSGPDVWQWIKVPPATPAAAAVNQAPAKRAARPPSP